MNIAFIKQPHLLAALHHWGSSVDHLAYCACFTIQIQVSVTGGYFQLLKNVFSLFGPHWQDQHFLPIANVLELVVIN